MDPKYSNIGEKIRDLRMSRGMTQKELAGESVTRNMLSLIENGNALPSLPTLVYLADKLNVSVGYFYAETDEEVAAFVKMGRISEIRNLYRIHDFAACLAACRQLPHPDEDISLISAECSLALAAESCERYALSTASAHLADAYDAASKDICSSTSLRSTVVFLERLLQCVNSPTLTDEVLDAALYPESRVPAELFAYLRALHFWDNGRGTDADAIVRSGLINSPVYRDVVTAKGMMRQEHYAEAFSLLQKILADEKPGFFTVYRVLDALESCASTLGDFKNAYQYSTEKIRLLEQFAK